MIDITKRYTSNNYGDFKVMEYVNCDFVRILFTATSNELVTRAISIRNGAVKDSLVPTVFGVGFMGNGEYKSRTKGKKNKAYKVWMNMLGRCYCPRVQENQPTYKGCSTTKEWHNFQNFAEWFGDNYIEGYHLDKDVKIKGNKIYSPASCSFITAADNAIEANAKSYMFTNPKGEVVEIYNLSDFCRRNSLGRENMIKVNQGKRRHHKGWQKTIQQP